MNIRAILLIGVSVLLLAGCGSSTDEEEENLREDTVFDPMIDTMNKAEQAGATIEDRVNQIDRQLEEQEEDDKQ
jgi:hypothetical protein